MKATSEHVPRVGVGALLLKGSTFLLGKRNPTYADALKSGGSWTMPGGKLEFGETLVHAVCRELAEETGIIADEGSMEQFCVCDDIAGGAHFVTVGFVCSRFKGDLRTMEPEKISGWKWFPLSAPPEPLYAPSKHVLESFLKK